MIKNDTVPAFIEGLLSVIHCIRPLAHVISFNPNNYPKLEVLEHHFIYKEESSKYLACNKGVREFFEFVELQITPQFHSKLNKAWNQFTVNNFIS